MRKSTYNNYNSVHDVAIYLIIYFSKSERERERELQISEQQNGSEL